MKSFIARLSLTKKVFLIIVVALLGWGAYVLWFKPNVTVYQLATAARGTIVQRVSVTGNTAPVQSLDLAFENGGAVAVVNALVGGHVRAGDVIARLDTRDLQAQLAQAQANADAATAKLRSLQAGAQAADIQASLAALDKGKQDLLNMYSSVSNTNASAYAGANDAVRNQLSAFFSAPETANPQLTFSISDSQTLNDVQFKRLQASQELNSWGAELAAQNSTSPSSTLDAALQRASGHLAVVGNLLTSASTAVVEATSLQAATLAAYKTSLTTAFGDVNAASNNINTAAQNIASQKIAVQELQAKLDLKVAGTAPEDLAQQQALVEQAQASVQAIQVKITKASLLSPIDGVVTTQNAKVGQIAPAGAVLVSIISDNSLEVDANIPEADIGKVRAGDLAIMTLDAFPGRTFNGKISYIDPGETVIEGVPTYKTKFAFSDMGPEVKPGMTANLDITAATHDNVIYIPQRAIATDAAGNRTVRVYHGANQPLETRIVTVGLRDVNGNIEIASGLNEGDVVINSVQ